MGNNFYNSYIAPNNNQKNMNSTSDRLLRMKYFTKATASFITMYTKSTSCIILFGDSFFFNWDSLHARLNSHYEAWSYKKKKRKKITAYRKSV